MKRVLIPALLLLAACGTPQEQCINAATRDMRIVDGLIAETAGNIARGYAYVSVTEFHPEFIDCTPDATLENPDPAHRQCWEQVPTTLQKPVAIDLNAEAQKLASLQQKRATQARAAVATIAECRRVYPE